MRLTAYQTNQLRVLLRTACIARDKRCIKCGTTYTLETSHVFSKGAYRALQYDLNNVIALCHNCHHNFWHKYPHDALDWFIKKYPDRIEYLIEKKNNLVKLPEYSAIRSELISHISFYQS